MAEKEKVETQKAETVLNNIKAEIDKIDKKENKFFFFVMDTKDIPNGSLTYIYETAYQIKEMGYDVRMLHGEKEFVGVGRWLGEKYSSLPHFNIETDNIAISPSDFLFIPEIYSNVMAQTKDAPCKRIVLLQNYNYVSEIIMPGATWSDFGVRDCVATSNSLAEYIKGIFPNIRTQIVPPSIWPEYTPSDKPKKLIINLIGKNQSEINSIVKNFYWRFPAYKWLAFRNIGNISKAELATALQESLATIWVDETTSFGYSALEAMACGSIVIGKVPENEPEWLFADGKLKDNGVWFFKNRDVLQLIAGVVQSHLHNNIPNEIYDEMTKTASAYTLDVQKETIKKVYIDGFNAERKKELEIAYNTFKKNNETKEEEK